MTDIITHTLFPQTDEMDSSKKGVFTVPFNHALARRGDEVRVLSSEEAQEWVAKYGAKVEATTPRRMYNVAKKVLGL